MPKKSILYIITKSVWGGAGKYVFDLATGLPQTRFRPMVSAGPEPSPSASYGVNCQKNLFSKLKEKDIPYFEIKSFQRDVNAFKDIFAFFEILSLLFKTKSDIVHVSSAKAGGISGIAIFIYKLTGLFWNHFPYDRDGKTSPRAIFTAHGWTFHESRPKWQIFLIKIFSKLTCLFYDKIICVSEFDYQSAIKNKIAPERKLITIHNGIKPEDYNFYERTEKRFTVGTIGEKTKNKGHKYLAEAAKNFPKINFNIVSNMPDAAKYLKNFDIFILPSLKEGLPYVLLEAGLAEVPIIATNVGGIPEIIQNNETGILVNPANSEELAGAIRKLIENPELAKTLAKNAREKILKEFSFEKMLRETLAAYKN